LQPVDRFSPFLLPLLPLLLLLLLLLLRCNSRARGCELMAVARPLRPV
jgi:hypothetical protein